MDVTDDVTCTLRAEAHHPPCVLEQAVFENHSQDTRYPGSPVSYTHLRAHETDSYLVCRLLLEKKKKEQQKITLC